MLVILLIGRKEVYYVNIFHDGKQVTEIDVEYDPCIRFER